MKNVRVPKQQRGIQTKERIVKAAYLLFARKGIHGTNSKEIAAKARVSIGSFYSYFPDKKTLLLEMLEDHLDRCYAAIWQQSEPINFMEIGPAEIRAIIENVFKAYDLSPDFHRQTHALRYSDPDVNRVFERERNREIKQIQTIIKLNQNRLRIKNSYELAVIIQNSVESVAHTAKFLGPQIDEALLIDELTHMVQTFFLHGYKTDDAPDSHTTE